MSWKWFVYSGNNETIAIGPFLKL